MRAEVVQLEVLCGSGTGEQVSSICHIIALWQEISVAFDSTVWLTVKGVIKKKIQ